MLNHVQNNFYSFFNQETYPETPTEYLPQLLCKIIMTLTNYCAFLDLSDIHHALGLCLKLLTKVQPSMVTSPEPKAQMIPHQDHRGDDQLPQALLRQLEGIENGYEVIEHAHCEEEEHASSPSQPKQELKDSVEQRKDRKKESQEKDKDGKVEEEEKEVDERSKLIDGRDEESDDDSGAVQSLDRLASQPQKFSEANPPPTRLRRPTSLGSRQDSGSLLDEPMESPDQGKAFDRKPPAPSITSMANSESEKDGPPMFLMQACVQCFQTFFAKLITKKILPNADIIKTCLAKVQVGEVIVVNEKEDADDKEGGDSTDKDKQDGVKKKRKSREESSWKQKPEGVEDVRKRTDSALTSDQAARSYLSKQINIYIC